MVAGARAVSWGARGARGRESRCTRGTELSARRTLDLHRAAAIIFALVGILPLLLFLFFLWHFDLLVRTEAQAALLLALLVALLGYWVFHRMVGSISSLVRSLDVTTPVERAVRAPAERGAGAPAAAGVVTGLGSVAEIGEMANAFGRMLDDLRASTERLEDLVFKLGTLNEMVEMAAKIPRIQDLLADVLERTMRAVHARIGSIMLLDRDRQTLKVVVARGLPDAVLGGPEVRVGEGVAGKAVQLGEPVLVEDIESDARFAKVNDPKYGGGSFICMPLRVADRIIGVVNLAKKESAGAPSLTPPFSRTDLQFLNTLMTYTAYAVDNARLLEEAQVAARKLNEVVEDQKLRLTLAQQQMIQAAKLSALGELVAGVSHELNNPLAVLQGNLEIIADEAPPALRPHLLTMQKSIDRAGRIVQGLLTFGRKRPLQRQRVSLPRLLEQVLEVSAADLRLAGVVVQTEVAPDLPDIWADEHQLQQVFLNLITNAKQAMADVAGVRAVRVSMRPIAADRVSLVVEDTGPGISPDLIPSIFDPFVTTKGVRGTGLGLSISYGIVREHGGHIGVESRPGAGARFTIDLPVGAAAPEASAPAAPPARTYEGACVLVAEDDESVSEILRAHLEHAGYRTLNAASGEEALGRLDERVQLVIADYHLAGLDGLAFYREAVKRVPSLRRRFMFVTAGALPEEARRAVDEGRSRLLQKPFTRQQLLDGVREALT
ncbi:MAG: ATP-binding protein [Candidatus Rokuibacteriota bacterium]